jgi:hypothetical protein
VTVRSRPSISVTSCWSRLASAVAVFAAPPMNLDRSSSRCPRTASEAIATGMNAGPHSASDRFSARPPPPSIVTESPCTKRVSCSRVSWWRPVSTSSSCTGTAVCEIGSVWPESTVGAWGVPGRSSTKKLPSRKMRGRILIVASLWIGSPTFLIVIVTIAVLPGPRSTFLTRPTSTPAIRTGERDCSSSPDVTTAFSS